MRLFSVAFIVLFACPLLAQSFTNPRRLPTGVDPSLVLAGDLNGDGHIDLIYDTPATLNGAAVLHPLLADGQGGYTPGQDVTLPKPLFSRCRLGDLNGDGTPDLVCVALSPSASMGVLLGQGDGTFGPATLYSPPNSPNCDAPFPAAIADVDGDGHTDIVTSCQNQAELYLYRGDGQGHVTPVAPVRSYASVLLTADLNGDGKPDFVTQATGSMSTEVLLGEGDGTFTHASYPSGNSGVVLADMDGDGHPDLIGGGAGILKIFHGNEDGSFDTTPIASVDFSDGTTTPSHSDGTGTGVFAEPLACADLNGDGILDILAAGTNGLTVLLGKAGLHFAAPRSYPVGASPTLYPFLSDHQLVDLDGDGHLDFVSNGPNGIYVSYGRADGTFASAGVYRSGLSVSGVTLADFDEDGTSDAVTSGDTQLYLSLGSADGTFGAATAIPGQLAPLANSTFQGYVSVAHGDTNGDGHQDLVAVGAVQEFQRGVYVLTGHGDGTFAAPRLVQLLGAFDFVSAVLDLNNDGLDDIVLIQSGLKQSFTALLGQRDGSFRSLSTALTTPASETISPDVSLGDVNGDGVPDLVYPANTAFAVALNHGDGSFTPPLFFSVPVVPASRSQSIAATTIGDFDGDGTTDIAILAGYTPATETYPNGETALFTFSRQGSGIALDSSSFSVGVPGPLSRRYYVALQSADLDGDGLQDVIASSYEPFYVPDAIGVFRGQSTHTVAAETIFVAGVAASKPSMADLNHDGRPDLVSANATGDAFTVLLSQGDSLVTGTLTAMPRPVLVGSGFTITASVRAPGQAGPLQGTVAFSVDGTIVGRAALRGGVATVAGPSNLAAGTHNLEAVTSSLTADGSLYPGVTLHGTESVNLLPVFISLSASPSAVIAGQGLTFHVHATNVPEAVTGTPVPGGALSLLVDGVATASGGTPDSSGLSFDLPFTFSAAGSHNVTATYAGDANHASGSTTLSVLVGTAAMVGTFKLSATPVAVTVPSGQQAHIALDVASVGGFEGTVLLGYEALPASLAATFSDTAVAVSSAASGQAMLVLTTGVTQTGQPPRGRHVRTAATVFGLGALLVLPLSWRTRRLRGALLTCMAAVLAVGLSGCGTLRESLTGTSGVGVFHITVIGNSRGSTAPQKLDITLTVTP